MAHELHDYTGPFKPDIQLEDLSREFLLRLIKCYQDSYMIMVGAWARALGERMSTEDLTDATVEMWLIAGPQVAEATCKAMRVDHRGIEGYFKRRQLDVGMFLKDIIANWEIRSPTEGHMFIPEQPHYLGEPTDEMVLCSRAIELCTAQICGFFADPNLLYYTNKIPLVEPGDIEFDIDMKIVDPAENPYPYYSGRNIKGHGHFDQAEFKRPWTEDQIKELWAYITPPIRKLLIEMARRPNGYPEAELAENLGTTVTNATYLLNFVFLALFDSPWPNKRMPFHFVGNPVEYKMDEDWARVLTGSTDMMSLPQAPLPVRA